MVIIWGNEVPYMAHIWKITGYIKPKYGFYNKHIFPSIFKYGVYMDGNPNHANAIECEMHVYGRGQQMQVD